MNRKGTIDHFFKNKRNILSLKKKIKMVDKIITPIELSDDEDINCTEPSIINRSDCSDSSNATEPYSLDSFTKTPSKQTPSKVSPTNYRSPTSKPKYFSPIKKRSLSMKDSPSKAKRNINHALMEAANEDIYQESEFLNYTQGLDDKTIFLLSIIYQFLKDDSLKLLLQETSTALLLKSLVVKKPGMRIVCRLFWRHGIWYRLENIKKIAENKSDIETVTLNEVLSSLVANGFLNTSEGENGLCYEDLVNLLNSSELLEICKSFKLKVHKKDAAKHALKNYSNQKMNMTSFLTGVSHSNNKNRVLKALSLKVGACYKLSDLARTTLEELYILMYLGMDYSVIRDKKLELTLLNEKSKRECYPVHKDILVDSADVVFKDRQEFERYLKAHAIYEDFLAATETKLKCDIVKQVFNLYNGIDKELMESYTSKPVWLLRFTPPHFYVKILAEGIQDLKRDKIPEDLDLAVKILTTLIEQYSFRQHKKSEWYCEKALILDKLCQWPDLAAEVLLQAFQAVLPEEHREILKVRAHRLVNRKTNAITASLKDKLLPYLENNDIKEKNIKATHIYKVPMCNSAGRGKVKFETRTSMGVQVQDAEDYCVSHYIDEGKYTHGHHWEGRIVTTIFFILFWDIIYTHIRGLRGIFLSHYQMYPLDMFTDSFYRNRKALIEEKLKEIEESSVEDLLDKIDSTWKSRPENEVSGVDRSTSLPQVCAVVRSLGARRSAALCRRLAADYSRTHSGFPDLTMWNERTGLITFVEVKTDTDKPSIKQIQWMHYMKQHDIDTEFCYVGVNTTRCKARNCDD